MEKIIHKLINELIQGVDTYTHNGSTWLIFTESKQWVIELTESKTLWYNYTFFQEIFIYASLDVVEHQQYITKWVEDNIINKVNYTEIGWHQCNNIDDTIERGVKGTITSESRSRLTAENIIENGVKETQFHSNENKIWIEGVIEDGVRDISPMTQYTDWQVEKIIENGVKETKSDDFNVSQFLCEEVIKKGVKETNHVDVMKFFNNKMEDTLENGMKVTKGTPGWTRTDKKISNVIDNGIKETFVCDWDVPTDLIEDVITDGVKDTKVCNYTDPKTQLVWVKWGNQIDEVIEEGEKISGTYVGGNRQKENIESVIGYGIKETKTPGEDGDIVGVTNWMMENNTKNVPKMIDDVIDNGVKEVKSWNDSIIGDLNQNGLIDNVINEGIKETKGDASQNPMGKVTKVVKEGIKTPTD